MPQLTMYDGILFIRQHTYIERVNYHSVTRYFITCGYRPITAQAIAYGTLSDREKTIALAQLIKLLAF